MTVYNNQKIQEFLETLYITKVEKIFDDSVISDMISKNDYEQLKNEKYVIEKDNIFYITDKGLEEGRNVVRRHRLAEKLLGDVLDVREQNINEAACGFEHYISKEVETKICEFLGHPTHCPHGKFIPPGECCKSALKEREKLKCTLTKLLPGESATVLYINTKDSNEMQKLMSIGLLPGIEIKKIRSFPSIVFMMGYSQFAIDEAIGNIVYVRRKI